LTRFDSDTLSAEGLEQATYSKVVAVNRATAHPHEETNGNVLNLGNSLVLNY